MARYDAWVRGFAWACWQAAQREYYPGQMPGERRTAGATPADMIPDDEIQEKPTDDVDPLAVECG